MKQKMMLESDDIWVKIRPNMNAEDDLLFSNLRDIYREGIPRKEFTKTKLMVQENFILFFLKLVEKNLLVVQKSYLLEHFGVTSSAKFKVQRNHKNCLSSLVFHIVANIQFITQC